MKHLIITTILIIFSNWGLAQSPYAHKIDSIQNLLNTQPKEDTTKVKRLNDLAHLCSFDLQFARSFHAVKQARQLSKKLNYQKGEGLYLNHMRLILVNSFLSNYYDIKKTLLYADIKEKEEPNKLTEIFPENRDTEKVIVKLSEAFEYFEKENDKEMMAHILYYISVNYKMLNQTNESIQYADRAIKLFKETSLHELAFMVLLEKIVQLHLNKKINEANEVEKEAKFIIENIKTVREKALLNFCLGRLYVNNVKSKKTLGFEYLLKADYELEKIGEKDLRIDVLTALGFSFDHVGMYQKSLDYFKKVIALKSETKQLDDIAYIYVEALFELVPLKKFDEAKQYLDKAKSFADEIKGKQDRAWLEARIHDASGQLLMGQRRYKEALGEYFQANKIAKDLNEERITMYFNSYIAQCYQKLGDLDKSIFYGERSYEQILIMGSEDWLKINTSSLLSEVYELSGQSKKAFEYLKKYRDHIKEKEEQEINNLSTNMAIENITQKNEQEKAALEKEKLIKEHENKNQRWWLFSIGAALLSSFVFLYFLYRNNQNKQKANVILENALSKLKSTQAQLIQSEKMASLGELTAGIAHEIQNPLNFVNNFSEVSNELIEEVLEERKKDQDARNEEIEDGILTDIKENLTKINLHGKRASDIVKGMLEHSRKSTGEKESTDINTLCDEYFRLAYQSMKAKDNNFNAAMETHFDPNLPKIEIIPQDIGRVILNLINNAFYAVNERSKKVEEGYQPTVSITTLRVDSPLGLPADQAGVGGELGKGDYIQISIKDNGPGIPAHIKDKIFQPFFTTKPTGQGTGLGLSLSYDIVKAHGGALKLESKENLGSEFIITIPII